VNGTSTRRVVVEPGGAGVVAHVGLHALGAFADRLGLGDSLSARIPPAGERLPLHDRGKVLVQTSLMLAGGGESCADIEHLRLQEDLFGSVPSDTTVFRTFHEITPSTRIGIADAMAEVRSEVWRRSSATTGSDPVLLDIDASLVEIHSEHKMSAAPTFKGGYGFHPMFCLADATGEALASLLRPGNAGANTVADHVRVLDDAVVQLPEKIGALALPLHQLRGQHQLDDGSHHGGRSAALVPAALPRWSLGACAAQSAPLGRLARAGSPHPSLPTARRAHHRRLARHRRVARRLSPHRADQLNELTSRQSAPR